MKINKNSNGWTLQPYTDKEAELLAFLISALDLAYGVTGETRESDEHPATHSLPLDQTPYKVSVKG